MSALTDRASLLRAYFRLVNADSADDDMIEHDDSTLEGAYHLLQMGVWDAQLYLITCGASSRWAATSSTLTLTGSDPDRYVALPSDFLRLESSDRRSGVRYPTGISWGRQVPYERRFDFVGNFFYLRGDEATAPGGVRLYVCRGAAFPSTAIVDYIAKHATLADSTTVDFDEMHRDLIPAFAAYRASLESWFAGGPDQGDAIMTNLQFQKDQAWRNTRYSREPKRVPVPAVIGDRWYT